MSTAGDGKNEAAGREVEAIIDQVHALEHRILTLQASVCMDFDDMQIFERAKRDLRNVGHDLFPGVAAAWRSKPSWASGTAPACVGGPAASAIDAEPVPTHREGRSGAAASPGSAEQRLEETRSS